MLKIRLTKVLHHATASVVLPQEMGNAILPSTAPAKHRSGPWSWGGEPGLTVLLVSVDRMNLWEVADFLKKNGVINAINLDGGGSSTYVVGGSLASYPSDHWSAR